MVKAGFSFLLVERKSASLTLINPSGKYFTFQPYELCSNPGTVIPAKAGIQPFLSDVELNMM